jgi:hypothetical protein
MEVMFELTRRCDMKCYHCLRGDAEGLDMSEDTMRVALNMFGGYMSQIDMGGGEATLKPKLLAKFLQQIHWSGINFQWLEPMWFVTNGKRLLNQSETHWKVDPYDDIDDDEYVEPENTELADVLVKFSEIMRINLAVSTDSWHDAGAEDRHRHVEFIFENYDNIRIFAHGPRSSDSLISMGRNAGGGKDLHIEADSSLRYITLKGDVYTACDLSYEFMDTFTDSPLCLGNIHTNTFGEIEAANEVLNGILCADGNAGVDVGHNDISELEELIVKFNTLIKEVA